jgi:hypothetical protein
MIIHTHHGNEEQQPSRETYKSTHRCAFEGLWPVYIGRRANRITADKRIHQIILKTFRSVWLGVHKRRRLTSSHGGRAPEKKEKKEAWAAAALCFHVGI